MNRVQAIEIIATYERWAPDITNTAEARARLEHLTDAQAFAYARRYIEAAQRVADASREMPGSLQDVSAKLIERAKHDSALAKDLTAIRGLWFNQHCAIGHLLDQQPH